ncbi:chitin deacetylase CDA2 [Sugiyamaella lignohabitans]|uniref:chitin deacetylase n=1 Tax=Sugiyamaella lignohabitans TaxID=796027 RepID=A0A167EW07_9ASCO|nr:chitin deacetylase CDA2 [Sugiyamaella lignohabitans]ANB14531.1 chitin deacetylase CDA2 [Sugiyamaella lignohabitans]
MKLYATALLVFSTVATAKSNDETKPINPLLLSSPRNIDHSAKYINLPISPGKLRENLQNHASGPQTYGTGSKPSHLDRTLADYTVPSRQEIGIGGGISGNNQGVKIYAQFKQPFPDWLQSITGLTKWPDENAPYIPLDDIDLSVVPKIPKRSLGDCSNVERSHCSFECYRCVAPDDIITCPVMSQTFDDGPSPSTPKLLDQLPIKTTFFTQGINVVRFPETVRLQHQEGHLLASHTWSHANLPGLSNEDIAAQIQWSIWAINATAGVVPRYFRPPYGAIDDRVRTITRQFGLVAVFWDKDTFDWRVNDRSKTENEVYQEVRQWQAETPGALILEHDSTIKTVNVGIEVSRLIHSKQMTVADCVNGPWYND